MQSRTRARCQLRRSTAFPSPRSNLARSGSRRRYQKSRKSANTKPNRDQRRRKPSGRRDGQPHIEAIGPPRRAQHRAAHHDHQKRPKAVKSLCPSMSFATLEPAAAPIMPDIVKRNAHGHLTLPRSRMRNQIGERAHGDGDRARSDCDMRRTDSDAINRKRTAHTDPPPPIRPRIAPARPPAAIVDKSPGDIDRTFPSAQDQVRERQGPDRQEALLTALQAPLPVRRLHPVQSGLDRRFRPNKSQIRKSQHIHIFIVRF